MRKVLCVMAVLAIVAPASATNLDPADAIPWAAPWGNDANVVVQPDGSVTMDVGGNGSAGIFWRLCALPSEPVSVTGLWDGDCGGGGWAEVLIFTCTDAMSDDDIGAFIDGTGAGSPEIVAKHDSWDLGPIVFNEPIENGATGWGPFEIHATCPEYVIGLKVGNTAVVHFDIDAVPEPASALLLGLPMLLVRRRR